VILTPKQEESLSKFMSMILRHALEQFSLKLDHEGYCDIKDLIQGIRSESRWADVFESDIKQVVDHCGT
jgi:putative RNA 2'-phosphotransferase